jgi:hypothetical protein
VLTSGPYAFDVPLRVGHQFGGPNGLIFEMGQEKIIPSGNVNIEVGVYQGKTYAEVFVSDGTANQVFNLSLVPDDEFLAQGKMLLTVDLDVWDEEDFLPYGALDNYEVTYLSSPPQIRFGDGVIGKIPPVNAEIRVSYVATNGKNASLATSNTVTESITPVVVNFQQIPISVTNNDPATGGADAESMRSIKANAPRYFLAADRLVTKGDYNVLAGKFSSLSGAVAKANAIIVRGVGDDLELQDLMAALVADRVLLDGYLNSIDQNQDDIKALTGDALVDDTIRSETNKTVDYNTSIRLKTDDIDTQVTAVKGNISDCRDDIDLAKTQLDFMPFQEMIAMGDSVKDSFSFDLANKPIKEGSFTIFVADQAAVKDGSDGDCDATPGKLIATITAPGFESTDVGRMVRIGGEYRQIQKVGNPTTIEYSGPRIYGTSLIVEVFPAVRIGYSDFDGLISGSGFGGSINRFGNVACSP